MGGCTCRKLGGVHAGKGGVHVVVAGPFSIPQLSFIIWIDARITNKIQQMNSATIFKKLKDRTKFTKSTLRKIFIRETKRTNIKSFSGSLIPEPVYVFFSRSPGPAPLL